MATGTVEMVQRNQRLWFHRACSGKKDVFVHISAVERAGLTTLADGQEVTFDIEAGRDGRESASNLQLA